MDLRQLRTFVTVAEQGTVSRASAELRVAQPALSRQIQDLENELGIKLFDRIRRRLILTTEGKLLLSDCRGTLNAVSSIREKAQMLRRPDAGVLSVAATPQTIDGVLSGFLARYAKERPNVHVTLIEAVGAELMAVLHRGEAHLLITTAGAIETSDQPVDTIWLPSLEFIAASSPGCEAWAFAAGWTFAAWAHIRFFCRTGASRSGRPSMLLVALPNSSRTSGSKAGPRIHCWRLLKPALGSRWFPRCFRPIDTNCRWSG